MKWNLRWNGKVWSKREVEITEGKLPASYYYTLEPAVAMSANYQFRERLKTRKGIVKQVHQTERGFFVTVLFDE